MKLIRTYEILGNLRNFTVAVRRLKLRTDRGSHDVEKNFLHAAAVLGIISEAVICRPLDDMSHQSLWNTCIYAIHRHMVAIVRSPSERKFRQIAGADHDAPVLVRHIHKDLRALARLRVLVSGICQCRIMSDVFEEDIVKPRIRRIVHDRLVECGEDLKAAEKSLKKSPLFLDEEKTIQLEYASCYKKEYVIKYPLESIKTKDTESIVDKHIREVVAARLAEFGGDSKKAFANPLYADADERIPIKSVRCYTGLSQVVPLKKDNSGREIGFVKPGNNHHIAIYKDSDGDWQESIVTFWDAVERKKYGIPVVVRNPVEVWDNIIDKNVPEDLANGLPAPDWTYVMSMQLNEMFVLGMGDDEFNDAMAAKDYKALGEHLYRVQKVAKSDYFFRNQYETKLDDSKNALAMKKYYRTQSFNALLALNPRKVSISLLGEISLKDD